MQVDSVRSEVALAQEQVSAEKFLEMTTDLFSVLFIVYDTDSKKLSYNFEQLGAALGYHADALRNMGNFNLFDIFHKGDAPIFLALLECMDERPTDITCRLMNVAGDFVPFIFKTRCTNAHGHRIMMMRAISTASPFMDAERKILNETINDLKQTNRELEDFAYVASHDRMYDNNG